MARLELTEVPGIGAVTAERLRAIGVHDVGALATRPVDDLAALPGFHPARAATVQAAARELLGLTADDSGPVAKVASPATKAQSAKPAKGKGKKKKKKKKKNAKASKSKSRSSKGTSDPDKTATKAKAAKKLKKKRAKAKAELKKTKKKAATKAKKRKK